MTSIDTLTARQIVAVYNHHAPTPVARFENSTKARRRLQTLLSGLGLQSADAIAAVIGNAAQQAEVVSDEANCAPACTAEAIDDDGSRTEVAVTPEMEQQANEAPLPGDPDWTPADMGFGDKIEDDERIAAAKAEPVAVAGKARALIVAACSRPGGATSAELFATTGWKFASWSHQLKLITKQTGIAHEIRKVDGTTRYFLLSGKESK